jgi:hypothetical protein
MGYFCLTVVCSYGPHRAAAATTLSVDRSILAMLGELTSEYGGAAEARKHARSWRPLDSQQEEWIRCAVRALIRRVGEHDHDPTATLPLIGMADLPPVPAIRTRLSGTKS